MKIAVIGLLFMVVLRSEAITTSKWTIDIDKGTRLVF